MIAFALSTLLLTAPPVERFVPAYEQNEECIDDYFEILSSINDHAENNTQALQSIESILKKLLDKFEELQPSERLEP